MTPEYTPTAKLAKKYGRSSETIRSWAKKLGVTVYRNPGGDYMVRTDDAHRFDPTPVPTRATPKPVMTPAPPSERQLRETLHQLLRGSQ